MVYPSFVPGLETGLSVWMGTDGANPFYTGNWRYPDRFFADYVFARADWSVREFQWKRDLQLAREAVIGQSGAAENPDLSAFRARGGKLIQWHGWHDMAIPARNSVRYYQSVVDTMGQPQVDSFYRLFMGTGVNHCGGGNGPNVIGTGQDSAPQPYVDVCLDAFGPDHCMFASNFPADKGTCSYRVLWNALKRLSARFSPSERDSLFGGVARRTYRLADNAAL
jgi:hypothetical protein